MNNRGLSSATCEQWLEHLNWLKRSVIHVLHPLRNTRALYPAFLSTEGYTVTFQSNCSLTNNCCKVINLFAHLRNCYSMMVKKKKRFNYSAMYLLEGAANSGYEVNILQNRQITNANSTSKLPALWRELIYLT